MTDRYDLGGSPLPVLLGTNVRTRERVLLPYEDRPRGVSLIGKAGEGKSTVLENFILADIENGTPGLVIDPHGLLAERVMQLVAPEYKDRIILLEADQSAPFGLNLLDVRKPVNRNDDPVTWASDSVVATIKKLYGQDDNFLPRLERWLDVAVRTLIPNNGTLAETLRLFRSDEFRRQCLKNVDDPSIHEDWSEYESLRATDQISYIEAVVNRLGRMLRPPLLQSIIGSKKTTVPFNEILYGDSMLLVSLPSEELSQERCNFIASLVLHSFTDLVFTRKVSVQKPPRVHVYVDEYQRIASSTTNALIEQGRKYGVGLTIAHQTLQQIPDPKIRSASHQSGTLIVMALTRPDAEQLAGEFPVKPQPEWIERIEEVDGVEPEQVPVAHPVDHLFTTAHVDPLTDKAARLLLSEGRLREVRDSYGSSRDPKTGLELAPGGSYSYSLIDPTRPMRSMIGDGRLPHRLSAYQHNEVDQFLVRATEHELDDTQRLLDALVENGLFYKSGWNYLRCDFFMSDDKKRMYGRESELLFSEGFRPWISTYLDHREQCKAGDFDRDIFAIMEADQQLIDFARSRGWKEILEWMGPLSDEELEKLEDDRRSRILINLRSPDHIALGKIYERFRQLLILADGLAEDPILVPSGQMRPRKTTRLVHHPKQSEQDAINEFAAKLVNPKRKHVAHIKMLSGYHETLLRPPTDEEGVNARTPNPYQPDDIRSRSRALYDASAHQDDARPHVSPQEPPKRNITRRPRQQDTEQEE